VSIKQDLKKIKAGLIERRNELKEHLHKLSTEKVSEILDLTIAAVKSRLHRARLFLRKKLSHYFEEYQAQGDKK